MDTLIDTPTGKDGLPDKTLKIEIVNPEFAKEDLPEGTMAVLFVTKNGEKLQPVILPRTMGETRLCYHVDMAAVRAYITALQDQVEAQRKLTNNYRVLEDQKESLRLTNLTWSNLHGRARNALENHGVVGDHTLEDGIEKLYERTEAAEAMVIKLRSGGGCTLAGPGRGDCEHAVGLPGESIPGQHDGPDDTVDVYGKPNGWCWSCWKSHQIKLLEDTLAAKHIIEDQGRDRAMIEQAAENTALKERVDELHAEAMKVVTCAKSFGWSPLYHNTSPDEAVKFLKRQLEGEKRFAGDLNEQTAKQAQKILHLQTSYQELREAIKVLEPDMDHDHHTLMVLPKQLRQYIDEYLFPNLEKLNERDLKHVFTPLTFEDWLEHVGRFDATK